MQADEIGLAADAVHIGPFNAVLTGAALVPDHIMSQNFHVKAARPAGHALAYGSQAHNAQRFAVKVNARNLAPVSLPTAPVNERRLAGHGQHQGQGVVRHGIAVGPHGARNGNAPRLAGLQINIVQAHAVLGDGAQLWSGGQHSGVHGIHAQNDAFARGQFFPDGLFGEYAAAVIADDFQSGVAQCVKKFGIVFAKGTGSYKNFHGMRSFQLYCA